MIMPRLVGDAIENRSTKLTTPPADRTNCVTHFSAINNGLQSIPAMGKPKCMIRAIIASLACGNTRAAAEGK